MAQTEMKIKRNSFPGNILKHKNLGAIAGIVVFLLVFIFYSLQAPGFLTKVNLVRNMAMPASISAVIALGMTVVMVGGGIDLSISAIAGLAGLASAAAAAQFDAGLPGMLLAALAAGAFVGAINGTLVAYLGISPFVVTLSVVFLVSGLQYLIALGAVSGTYLMLPRDIGKLGAEPSFLIGTCLLMAVLLYVFLDHTVPGRNLRSLGQSLVASRFSGVKVRLMTFLSYIICGIFCAIGGVMLTFNESMARVGSGESYQIDAFLLPILGQTIFGKFSVEGTIFGALFMYMLINGLYILGAPPESIRIVKGVMLLSMILLSGIQKRLSSDNK